MQGQNRKKRRLECKIDKARISAKPKSVKEIFQEMARKNSGVQGLSPSGAISARASGVGLHQGNSQSENDPPSRQPIRTQHGN